WAVGAPTGESAAAHEASAARMECCVRLGSSALDTRGDARETATWLGETHTRSVRLVTSAWHMRRAAHELEMTLPEGVTVLRDAVRTEPSLWILFLEYHKLLATWLVGLAG